MLRVATLLAALLIAGCASPSNPVGHVPPAGDGAAAVAMALSATNCFEAGGHSVHPKFLNPLPAPWQPADIIDDVGDQLVYSEIPDPMNPIPQRGNTMGNYHATIICESWSVDGEPRTDRLFGFVGMKVETPPFGEPGPSHEYLVTVVATNDEDVAATLAAGGIHPMIASATVDGRSSGAGDLLDIHMETDHNGMYDSVFQRTDLGDLHAPWVRLWFQHENENGTFSPVALDMHSTGGIHFGAEGQGYFSHSGTDHHWPLPGAYGHTAALGYDGFDRTWSWGPAPLVFLTDAYVH